MAVLIVETVWAVVWQLYGAKTHSLSLSHTDIKTQINMHKTSKYKTHTENTQKLLTKVFIEQLLQLQTYIMAWTSLQHPLFTKLRREIFLKLKYYNPLLFNMQR